MNRFKSLDGFTLIEVLIAIAILSIGLLALAGMSTTAIKFTNYSKNKTTAVTVAQDRIEELKRQALISALVSSTATDTTIKNDVSFTRTASVTGGANQLTRLEVTITWSDYKSHTAILATLIRQ
ncbi:MAG: prepilin-type N-terminal cleavage/methylation domain-containing protein [Nitrospinae bacterium]|nr:prepilin-type N-terminal cleavage/methylation domain-containing protein [Nitrospinota bacterium]